MHIVKQFELTLHARIIRPGKHDSLIPFSHTHGSLAILRIGTAVFPAFCLEFFLVIIKHLPQSGLSSQYGIKGIARCHFRPDLITGTPGNNLPQAGSRPLALFDLLGPVHGLCHDLHHLRFILGAHVFTHALLQFCHQGFNIHIFIITWLGLSFFFLDVKFRLNKKIDFMSTYQIKGDIPFFRDGSLFPLIAEIIGIDMTPSPGKLVIDNNLRLFTLERCNIPYLTLHLFVVPAGGL